MSLLFPLGLALAVSIPLLVLLYILKVRRQDLEVGSTYLWEQIARDLAAHEPWQRLRVSMLLILQIVILLALVGAVARPFVTVPTKGERFIVILLDSSASMQATDVAPSRFERAKQIAREVVHEATDDALITLISLKSHPELLAAATNNRRRLLGAIDAAKVTSGSTNAKDALPLALSLMKDREHAALYLISDGAFASPGDLGPLGSNVHLLPVGSRAANRAITAFTPRLDPKTAGRYQLFARVHSFSDQAAQDRLDLFADGRLIDSRRLDLKPGESAELIFDDVPLGVEVAEARLAGQDDLALDNAAYAVLGSGKVRKVLLVSGGNLFLEKAIFLQPNVELYRIAPNRYRYEDLDRYQVFIFDGYLPRDLPRGGVFLINPPGSGLLSAEGVMERPPISTWRREDPLLRFVDFAETRLARAQIMEMPSWGRTLMESRGRPLMIAGQVNGQPVVAFTFDFRQSNFPVQPAFPILVANVLNYLAPFDAPGFGPIQSGEPLVVPPLPQVDEIRLERPDGRSNGLKVEGGKPVGFGELNTPGVHRFVQVVGNKEVGRQTFAVNFTSDQESDIRPQYTTPGADTAAPVSDQVPARRELWQPLVAVVLGLLLLEWWWFHRRP